MRYMVIEHYTQGPRPVYERAAKHGRLLPDGLHYLDSWVVDNLQLATCFQLMETDDLALLNLWREQWSDLVDFDVHPVISSADAAARVNVT